MFKKIFILLLSIWILLFSAACSSELPKDSGVGRDQIDTSFSSESEGDSSSSESHSEELPPPEPKGITVCVDPGHGFKDGGTSSDMLGGVKESDIVLDIAIKLGELLEGAGYEVIFTHDGVTFPRTSIDDGNDIFNPNERVAYANTLDIDFFISIHCDSYVSNPDVRGTRIYYYNELGADEKNAMRDSAANKILAGIDDCVNDTKSPIVRPMDSSTAYRVIKSTNTVAVLVETGFVTNPSDAEKMLTDTWREEMAEGLFSGINAYFSIE